MKKDEINRILLITISITVIYTISLQFFGINTFSIDGLKKVSFLFSSLVFLWGGYFAYGWKLPILNMILPKTNLNGTWFGTYSSKDDKGAEYKGEIALVIRQSFLNINVTSHTAQYLSYSFAETLLHNKDSDSSQLIYLYSQNEFDPTDENVRRGASELHLLCELKNHKLFGEFWTNSKSRGTLRVEHLTKRHHGSFKDIKKIIKV